MNSYEFATIMNTLIEPTTETSMANLFKNALIIELNIGCPSGSKSINNAAQKIRQYFVLVTGKWGGNSGIIDAAYLDPIKSKLDELIIAFNTEVANSIKDFFGEDEERMAYRNKFYVSYEVRPVEKPGFHSESMSADRIAHVNMIISESLTNNLRSLELSLINRVRDKLIHFVDRLMNPDSKIHNSIKVNILETITECRKLNVNQNPVLTELFELVGLKINTVDIGVVRVNDARRDEAILMGASSLERIKEVMETY
jgi:hypothetical protein